MHTKSRKTGKSKGPRNKRGPTGIKQIPAMNTPRTKERGKERIEKHNKIVKVRATEFKKMSLSVT
jgi:hypothetical protein